MAAVAVELTSREEQVLFAIADGMQDAEIGAELFLSRETIRTYVNSLLRKLGARNRTHAVALAYHHGILVPQNTHDGDDA